MFDSVNIWIWAIVVLDLVVAVAAICALRYVSGLLFGVDSRNELAEKDNLAFGLTLAGGAGAVALVLAAATAGDPAVDLAQELGVVALYAVLGLLLLKAGMLINDWVVFNEFSLKEAINSGNVAAGTAQAANLIAIGILVNAAIDYSEGGLATAVAALVIVFLLAQLVLLAVTRVRGAIYSRRNDGAKWQAAIDGGNTALGVRYAGHLIGTALAVSSAGGMIAYLVPPDAGMVVVYAALLGLAIILAGVLLLLSMLAQRAILHGIDVVQEVDVQANVGVGAIEAAVFIGVGLVMHAVIG